MWIWLALISSVLLGFYDVAKKRSVEGNAVLPVLTVATSVSAIFFLPVILSSEFSLGWFAEGSMFYVTPIPLEQHLLIQEMGRLEVLVILEAVLVRDLAPAQEVLLAEEHHCLVLNHVLKH
jgi:hypothetical protein